jgi:hypothetical protein
MNKYITHFREIRRDGKVIDENMSVDKLWAEGWKPEIVTSVQWRLEDQLIELHFPSGVLARPLRDRSAVVILSPILGSSLARELWVVNPNGTKRLSISNTQTVNGVIMVGTFEWIGDPRSHSPVTFGAMFQNSADSEMYELDIDATTGMLLNAFWSK